MTCFGCRRTLRLAVASVMLAAWLPGCQDRDDQPTVDREAAGTTGGQPHDTSGMTAGSRDTLGATTPPTTHQTTDSTPRDTAAPDPAQEPARAPARRTAPPARPRPDSAVPAPRAADSTAPGGDTTPDTAPQASTDSAPQAAADTPPQDTGATAAAPRDPYHPAPRDTVDQVTYNGWKQYNLNCARCHGEDVLGTTIAPHLVQSLKNGSIASKEQFIQVVCSGRPEKGMPAWCPLGLDFPTIESIYQYVKARSDGRMHPGRPARRET